MVKKLWVGDYYDAKGNRKRKSFATKPEADQWEAEGRAEAANARASAASKMLRRATGASVAGRK
jgi:hypothetical protein